MPTQARRGMWAPRQRAMPPYAGALNYGYHLDAGKLVVEIINGNIRPIFRTRRYRFVEQGGRELHHVRDPQGNGSGLAASRRLGLHLLAVINHFFDLLKDRHEGVEIGS